MPRRSPLPPPPPPVEIRTWPDRDALLRDRSVILGELVRMHVGRGRLGMLWLWGAVTALGWSFVGSAIRVFEDPHDVFSALLGVTGIAIGGCLLVPSVAFAVLGLARDRRVRRLLDEWGGLDRDPEGDMRLRVPGLGAAWMVMSFVLCAAGLYACVVVPAGARAGEETYGLVVLLMGLGFIAWHTGLTGLVTAFAHRRWMLRVLVGTQPAAPLLSVGGGAHH